MKRLFKTTATVLGLATCFVQVCEAGFTFAEWNSAGVNNVDGTLDGIGVHYTGQVAASTQVGDTGIQYWQEYGHDLPYTPVTGTLPPRKDIVALSTIGTFKITFDNPVMNPVMLLCSLGQPGITVSYSFNQPATVLTSGYSYWNELLWPYPGSLTQNGSQIVVGREGDGVIGFSGWVSEIEWTTDSLEYWHGITLADGEDWHTITLPPLPPTDAVAVPEASTSIAGLLLVLFSCSHVLKHFNNRWREQNETSEPRR